MMNIEGYDRIWLYLNLSHEGNRLSALNVLKKCFFLFFFFFIFKALQNHISHAREITFFSLEQLHGLNKNFFFPYATNRLSHVGFLTIRLT